MKRVALFAVGLGLGWGVAWMQSGERSRAAELSTNLAEAPASDSLSLRRSRSSWIDRLAFAEPNLDHMEKIEPRQWSRWVEESRTQASPDRDVLIALAASAWQLGDAEYLLRFSMQLAEGGDDLLLHQTLRLLFHQEPETVLPHVNWIALLGGFYHRFPSRWLNKISAAYGRERGRSSALAYHSQRGRALGSANPIDSREAFEAAVADGKTLEESLVAWSLIDPKAAWTTAEQELGGFRSGSVFERLFFRWVRSDPEEAFVNRDRMASVLVETTMGEVRNAGYVDHVIGETLAKRDSAKAIETALTLDLDGPFQAFVQGIIDEGAFPGADALAPLLAKARASDWIGDNLLAWIADNMPRDEAIGWAERSLSVRDQDVLAARYPSEEGVAADENESLEGHGRDQSFASRVAASWSEAEGKVNEVIYDEMLAWFRVDSSAARQWVELQDAPELRDVLRRCELTAYLEEGPDGLERARVLVLEMESDLLRRRAIHSVFRRWVLVDPRGLLRILDGSPLDEASRGHYRQWAESKAALLTAVRKALKQYKQ